MAAPQAIDTALFRFINETLRNPIFDWIMPVFAGGVWFLPLLFIGGAALIWKGGTRGRLCVFFLALALVIGDFPRRRCHSRPQTCYRPFASVCHAGERQPADAVGTSAAR